MKDLMNMLCQQRPVGTPNNNIINDYLEKQLTMWGYKVISIPFDCVVWNYGVSQLNTIDRKIEINPSPYSEGFTGSGELVLADSFDSLKVINCTDKILLLCGELTQSALQPKDYPFYYPDEHKQIIDLLEQKAPKAIIALTGSDELSGLSPFSLFDDGNFLIPSACMSISLLDTLKQYIGTIVNVSLVSSKQKQQSRQIIATKQGNNASKKIVICAHMDSKYNTPGALDNAAGVAVLMEAAKKLIVEGYSIDIVPFNSEEYFGACGELAYIQYIKDNKEKISLLINIDAPCHRGADNAVSFYNFEPQNQQKAISLLAECKHIVEGQQWYAGDHCAFIFDGTPGAVISSNDLFEGGLADTHTPRDTIDGVDLDLICCAAEYIKKLIQSYVD